MSKALFVLASLVLLACALPRPGNSDGDSEHSREDFSCDATGLDYGTLRKTLRDVVADYQDEYSNGDVNFGFGLDFWVTVVNRDGVNCWVAYSGENRNAQWPGSRTISAAKAYTTNAFSLDGNSFSTGQLLGLVQPGQSLFGLAEGNALDVTKVYTSDQDSYGTPRDPLVGQVTAGNILFGGGLALYNEDGVLVGGLGISGDTSCADHVVAWRLRHALELDFPPNNDNLPTGYPVCVANDPSYIATLLADYPLSSSP